MPLEWTRIALHPGGMDTRSDAKTISPMKALTVTNVRRGSPGAARKRQGFVRVADRLADQPGYVNADAQLLPAVAVAARGDELVGFDTRSPYIATRGRWQRRGTNALSLGGGGGGGGAALPITATVRRTAMKVRQDMSLADRAVAFGVEVYAWWAVERNEVWYSISDLASDASLLPPTRLEAAASRPRLVVVGATIFLFWVTDAGVLKVKVFSQDLFPNAMDKATTFVLASNVNTTNPVYDAAPRGNTAFYAYNTSTANTVELGTVGPYGIDFTIPLPPGQVTVSPVTHLAVCVRVPNAYDRNANYECGVFWGMTARVDGRMYTGQYLTPTAASATVFASVTSLANLTAVFGTFGVVDTASVLAETSSVGISDHYISINTLNLTGVVGTSSVFYRHSGLASKAFSWAWTTTAPSSSMATAVTLVRDSQLQPTYFVVSLESRDIMARILPGEAGGYPQKSHLPHVQVDGDPLRLALLGRTQFGSTFADRRVVYVDLDISPKPFPTVEAQGALYLPGGFVAQYDGTYAGESGFFLYPEGVTIAPLGTGGMLAGSYSYRVFFDYVNALGQHEMSTTAGPFTIDITGSGASAVRLTIPTLAHTNRGSLPIAIVIYRTTVNSTGTVFYRVSNPNVAVTGANGFVANRQDVDSVTFDDGMSDLVLTTQEIDYISQGELDNVAPDACSLIAAGNNRIFLSGFEDPDLIMASKLQSFGQAVSFNDSIQISMPPSKGPITALAILGSDLIVFRAEAIYRVVGPGPDNTGLNGTFETPITISTDVGCTNRLSIARTPAGLFFQSPKGIFQYTNDGLNYIGADVQRFIDAEDVTSAVALADRHEVRFTLASDRTLVFDYEEQKWSDWTIGGIHSCLWQGRHVILRNNYGVALVETEGVFQDDLISYSLIHETGWIEMGGLQGYQRVRDMLLLGARQGQHSLRIRAAYDFEDAWIDDVTADICAVVGALTEGSDRLYGGGEPAASDVAIYGGQFDTPEALATTAYYGVGPQYGLSSPYGGTEHVGGGFGLPATNVYELRHFFQRPKCSAIKIRIEDVQRIDPARLVIYPLLDSFSLTDITLTMGQKAGHAKPGPDRQY